MNTLIYKGKVTIKKLLNGRTRSIDVYYNNGTEVLFDTLCKVLGQESLFNINGALESSTSAYGVQRKDLPSCLKILNPNDGSSHLGPIEYVSKYYVPSTGAGSTSKVVVNFNFTSQMYNNNPSTAHSVNFQLTDNTEAKNVLATVPVTDYEVGVDETHKIIWEMYFQNSAVLAQTVEE